MKTYKIEELEKVGQTFDKDYSSLEEIKTEMKQKAYDEDKTLLISEINVDD